MSYHWQNPAVKNKQKSLFSFAEQVERRLEHEEKSGKWLVYLQVCLVFILIVLIAFAVLSARNPRNFPIRHVKIAATFTHIKPQILQNVINPYVDQAGFFALDAQNLRAAILQIPWVYMAEVQRVWPDKIIITVDEQKPLAVWNDTALINADGEIFTPSPDTFPSNLPKLNADPEQVRPTLSNYLALSKLLVPFGWKIVAFGDNALQGLHIVLDNKMQLYANEADGIDEVAKFLKLYKKLADDNKGKQLEVVDLRYNDGFAVKWDKNN